MRFGTTRLVKPEATAENLPAARLAPLIVEEAIPGFDSAALPPVQATMSETLIDGRRHPQFIYRWQYPGAQANPGALAAQGIRITLNSAGQPVIWEVLADTSGAKLIFVSHSLEAAARAEFGPPLPDRRFSVERGGAQSPETVVARVIEDGPTPMGPVVYLRAGTHDVSTLICRCMPSQAETIVAQQNYPLTTGQADFPRTQLEQRLRLPRAF